MITVAANGGTERRLALAEPGSSAVARPVSAWCSRRCRSPRFGSDRPWLAAADGGSPRAVMAVEWVGCAEQAGFGETGVVLDRRSSSQWSRLGAVGDAALPSRVARCAGAVDACSGSARKRARSRVRGGSTLGVLGSRFRAFVCCGWRGEERPVELTLLWVLAVVWATDIGAYCDRQDARRSACWRHAGAQERPGPALPAALVCAALTGWATARVSGFLRLCR